MSQPGTGHDARPLGPLITPFEASCGCFLRVLQHGVVDQGTCPDHVAETWPMVSTYRMPEGVPCVMPKVIDGR